MERILPDLPPSTYYWVLDITSDNHKTPNAYTKWLGQLIVDEKLKKLGVEFEDEDIEERVRHSQAFYHERGRKYREY